MSKKSPPASRYIKDYEEYRPRFNIEDELAPLSDYEFSDFDSDKSKSSESGHEYYTEKRSKLPLNHDLPRYLGDHAWVRPSASKLKSQDGDRVPEFKSERMQIDEAERRRIERERRRKEKIAEEKERMKKYDLSFLDDDYSSFSSASSYDSDDKKPSPEEMKLAEEAEANMKRIQKEKHLEQIRETAPFWEKLKEEEYEKQFKEDTEKLSERTHTCQLCKQNKLLLENRMKLNLGQGKGIKVKGSDDFTRKIGENQYPYEDRICKPCYNEKVYPALERKEKKRQTQLVKEKNKRIRKRNENRRRRRNMDHYQTMSGVAQGQLLTSMPTRNISDNETELSYLADTDERWKGGKNRKTRKRKRKKRKKTRKKRKRKKTRKKSKRKRKRKTKVKKR